MRSEQTTEPPGHPFPPVVRWAVFPALCAVWGAAGGVLAAVTGSPRNVPMISFVAGLLAAGAAFSVSISRRPWIALPTLPVVGVMVLVSGISLANAGSGPAGAREPLAILKTLFSNPEPTIYFLTILWLQAAAHLACLDRAWPRAIAAFSAAGVLAVAVAGVVVPKPDREGLALLAFFGTTAPLGGLRMSMAIAKRLHI